MYKVKDKHADNYVFIGGNTKYLKDCSQAEIEILIKNGKKEFFTTANSKELIEESVSDEIQKKK